jgi:asparagine synthase (glutamine-hydrolysing)
MCGIAGIVRVTPGPPPDERTLLRMAGAVRHRGPDGFGLLLDPGAGLVSTRLAIFDIPGGWQPLIGPGASALVYNGEVYNHPELRAELESAGEAFRTTSDTEVVLRLLERDGLAALDRLNGQFAFAWWEPEPRRLTMVRDRFGVRPLYWTTLADGTLVFGSEAKAIFASGELTAEPDLLGIDDVLTLWGPRPPRSAFRGVNQVAPGGIVVWERGEIVGERRWWAPETAAAAAGSPHDELEALLRDAVRLRLRADVPVGTYLSGGLDSSLITALAQQETDHQLRTFSIAFEDPGFDERAHQERVAAAIGTSHHVIEIGSAEIATSFPEVVRHAEVPLIRTAPVPLYRLAAEVRAQGITVVATGEGADELFWGYDLFKEVALRELHRHDPERAEALVDRLYGYLGADPGRRGAAFRRFVLETGAGDELLGSHLTRVEATAAVKALYAPEVAAEVAREPSLERLRATLPSAIGGWSRLERAAWLELTTLLEPYLLSAQGDRVAMASGVEGRFPFLDHRVFAHAVALRPERKLNGLEDKVALRELAARLLPGEIAGRGKQPYRAPEVAPFFAAGAPAWVEEMLAPPALERTGLWDPARVAQLVRRCRAGRATGVREGMALVGVLSTQLWHDEFVGRPASSYPAEMAEPRVRVDRAGTDRSLSGVA